MTSITYITFILYLVFLHLFSARNTLQKKVSVLYTYFFLIVVVCFRGYVFTDVFNYKPFFDMLPTITTIRSVDIVNLLWWEPGFFVYCLLIKSFSSNYFVYQFIDSIIDILLLYKCLKYYRCNDSFSIMVFLSLSGLLLFFDMQRNIKAILLFWYALRYIDTEKKNFFAYCFYILLGITFHYSAVIYLFITPLLFLRLNRQKLLFLFFGVLLFSVFSRAILLLAIPVITPLLTGRFLNMINDYVYTKNSYSVSRFFSFGMLEKIITFILVYKNFPSLYRKNKIIVNVFVLYFASYFLLNGFLEVSNRVSGLFVFNYSILWYQSFVCVKNKANKLCVLFVFFTYCILKMSLYSHPMQRYENILFNYSTFEERKEILKKTGNIR